MWAVGDLAELAQRHDHGAGSVVMDWEYLLFMLHRMGQLLGRAAAAVTNG